MRNVVRETDVPIQRQLITISYVHPAVLEHILSYMVTNGTSPHYKLIYLEHDCINWPS